MKGPKLTAKQARQLFSYDKASGIVRWKISPGGGVMAGDRAGTVGAAKLGGYRRRQIVYRRRIYKEHRLIWLLVKGEWPPKGRDPDHEDGDATNNRWANIRPATGTQNRANSRVSARNRSGFKYVRTLVDKTRARPYQAVVDSVFLGNFATPEEAHAVGIAHAQRKYGAFFNPGAPACKAKTKKARTPPRLSPQPKRSSASRTASI